MSDAEITFTGINARRLVPARLEYGTPAGYRLGRRNGELVLQAAYQWRQGSDIGHEWRDIPIVDLDEGEK